MSKSLIFQKRKGKNLSKVQNQFNKKIKRIKRLKEDIIQLENLLDFVKKEEATTIIPLEDEVISERMKWMQLLDSRYDHKSYRKKDRIAMEEIIINEAADLALNHEMEVAKSIFSKYNPEPFEKFKEEQNSIANDQVNEMFSEMFDMDIDIEMDDMKDFKSIFENLQNELKDKKHFNNDDDSKDVKEKTDAEKGVSKRIKSIYFSLAKELHPDKEADETIRNEKTELMKRITAAYKEQDIFTLLQIQVENGNLDSVDTIPTDEIKQFNVLLDAQVIDLSSIKESMLDFPLSPLYIYGSTSPKIKKEMKVRKNKLIQELEELLHTIKSCKTHIGLKRYLDERENSLDFMNIDLLNLLFEDEDSSELWEDNEEELWEN